MKRKPLFKNKTDYAVLAFIVLLVFMIARCESASASEWAVELQHDSNAGSTAFNKGLDRICARYAFTKKTAMYGCPLVGIGGNIKKDSFELGLTETIIPRVELEVRINRTEGVMDGGFGVRRVVGDGPFQLAIGGSYWLNESPGSNSDFTFNLSVRYVFRRSE